MNRVAHRMPIEDSDMLRDCCDGFSGSSSYPVPLEPTAESGTRAQEPTELRDCSQKDDAKRRGSPFVSGRRHVKGPSERMAATAHS